MVDEVHAINEAYAVAFRRRTSAPVSYLTSPAPWRVVDSYSELSAILDANGRSLGIVERAVAGRIVAAVNMVECGHGKEA